MTTRIELTDTLQSAMIKMAEGNPGALTVMIQAAKQGGTIDPDMAFGGLGVLLSLDTLKIYGCRIWMLYKDVCGEDLVKTLALLRAHQLGELEARYLNLAIDGAGELNVDHYLEWVQKQLPLFAAAQKTTSEVK